jgi:antitoxin component of MazEF toxin-antitoxin module
MIRTQQKIIKIGSSLGVVLPAKDLRQLGLRAGDEVKLTAEPAEVSSEDVELVALTQQLITRRKKALLNLVDR